MSIIWNWLRPQSSKPFDPEHHGEVTKICCSDICRHSRELCSCQECSEKHKGHIVMDYKKFKITQMNVIQEIKCRKKVQDMIRQYNQKLILFFQDVLEMETVKLLDDIDKKIFGKNFVQIYKRDLAGKNYYSFLHDFSTSYGEDTTILIQKAIKQKQLKVTSQFKQFIASNRILVEQSLIASMPRIRDDPNQAKIDKIKSIIPFPCQLTRKFQASKHRFQTSSLYKIGIKGPILLVAESNKGKIFGGFTPKMFPKDEYYEQDNRCRSFLFSLDHRAILPLKQQYKKFAIKGGNNLWFGRGDLVLAEECNKGNLSWAQIGRAYQLPSNVHIGNSDEWLAGSLYFRVVEYQIYQVESFFNGTK